MHTSLIEPLPHQITAVYDEMLTRQPLRFLLADDPGAGKTIMAGLLIRELILRGDVRRCLISAPGNLTEQWQDELRAQLPATIAQMRTGKILPVDLAQASIGPGMAIYPRYSRVLEANGTPVSVRQALSLINTVLAETLYEFVGEVDEYTRFAFDWFQQHQFEAGDAGSAETLAMAKNTSLPGLERAGLIELGAGLVRLLHWQDYDPSGYDPRRDDRPTVWEGAHHLIERLNSHGETGAALLLARMSPELAGAAQDLAFSLYDICDRNG